MSVFLFVVILVVLIIVHEFGHFIVAKLLGIRVDEFGIGFPPRALTLFKKGETTYTLNWIPFGGFVKIFGENPDEESISGPDSVRSFVHKPKWVQVLVLAAGVGFNVLIAWVIIFSVFVFGTTTTLAPSEVGHARDVSLRIIEVLPDSPAAQAGLAVGDTITGIEAGGEKLKEFSPDAATNFIAAHSTNPLVFTLLHEGQQETITTEAHTGVIADEPDRSAVGVGMSYVGVLRTPPLEALVAATKTTTSLLVNITVSLAAFFASAFTFSADLSQIAGPVGIVGLVGQAASFGAASVLMFMAFISLNLAVVNLLPVPALDGGRILFVLIEALKGSPIKPRVANTLNTAGFALLILLMIAITYHDILRIIG
jgi:regulator of sigma E protease